MGLDGRLAQEDWPITVTEWRGEIESTPSKAYQYKEQEPYQNPTIGVLVAEGDNVLGRGTGLWSTEAKV
jgi:hypothetical protein